MPKRFGKGFGPTLLAAVKLQLSHGKRTEFLFETSAQQTRLQKAIRELFRKEVLQRPNPTTLAAVTAAKADEVTEVSPDEI